MDVHEDFLGLYTVPSIHSTMLKEVMDDCLSRLNIPYSRVWGQGYDGAMSGARSEVAKLVMDEEPKSSYTHCYVMDEEPKNLLSFLQTTWFA